MPESARRNDEEYHFMPEPDFDPGTSRINLEAVPLHPPTPDISLLCRFLSFLSLPPSRCSKYRPQSHHCVLIQVLHRICHLSLTFCFFLQGFFRRSIQKQIEYRCLRDGKCLVIRLNRNRCQYCRFKKCLAVGMSRDCEYSLTNN